MPGTPELLVILAVVLLLFGGSKLPGLARSMGQAKREFEQATTKDDASAPNVADQANHAGQVRREDTKPSA